MINSCVQWLDEAVQKAPDKVAVIDENRQYTFRALKENALKVARSVPSDAIRLPIAVFLPKSSECMVCFMGILYSGNFYVPLDVKSPMERVKKILDNLAPRAIITSVEYREKLKQCPACTGVTFIDIDETLSAAAGPENEYVSRLAGVIDTDPMYCIYTSGSTGFPKGVVVPHRGVVNFIDWAEGYYSLDCNTVLGNQSPFYFDVSVFDMYVCLKCAATLYIIPEYLFAFPHRLVEFVAEKKINCIIWVPSVLISVAATDALSNRNAGCLKKILFAGEVMPNKQLNYWRRHLPDALYSNLYGPTETSVIACAYILQRDFKDSDPLPIGFPCRNADILVLDSAGRPVGAGEPGELYIRGDLLAAGYWNDRERTEKVFIQNPLNTRFPERVYRTGDIVKYNEYGEIVYLGRQDYQIKHMGYRIELGEIEGAALSLDGIDNACVLYDNETGRILLFYQSSQGDIDDLGIKKALYTLLPKYMIPAECVRLEQMPLNTSGKIDRIELSNRLRSLPSQQAMD